MGKRKNKTQYVTWEDLKIIINSYKQVLESDLGNRDEDISQPPTAKAGACKSPD